MEKEKNSMNERKRKALLTLTKSGLALLLSIILLASTTYAWFTISVTSLDNTFKAGLIDFKVKGYDTKGTSGTSGPEDYYTLVKNTADSPRNLSAGEHLIKEINFAPGDYNVKYIEVENIGTLSLLYKIVFNFIGLDPDVANLTNVIKIRITPVGSTEPTAYTPEEDDLADLTGFDTLFNWLKKSKTDNSFEWDKDKEILDDKTTSNKTTRWIRVEYFYCPYSANGTYGDLDLEMNLTIAAIQAKAGLENLIFVGNEKGFIDAVTDGIEGSTIVFLNDIVLTSDLTIKKAFNFDLGGHTLDASGQTLKFEIENGCAIDIANGTIIAETIRFEYDDNVVNLGNKDGELNLDLKEEYTKSEDTTVYDNGKRLKIVSINHHFGEIFFIDGKCWVKVTGQATYSNGAVKDYKKDITVPVLEGTTPGVTTGENSEFKVTVYWTMSDPPFPLPPPTAVSPSNNKRELAPGITGTEGDKPWPWS